MKSILSLIIFATHFVPLEPDRMDWCDMRQPSGFVWTAITSNKRASLRLRNVDIDCALSQTPSSTPLI